MSRLAGDEALRASKSGRPTKPGWMKLTNVRTEWMKKKNEEEEEAAGVGDNDGRKKKSERWLWWSLTSSHVLRCHSRSIIHALRSPFSFSSSSSSSSLLIFRTSFLSSSRCADHDDHGDAVSPKDLARRVSKSGGRSRIRIWSAWAFFLLLAVSNWVESELERV